MVKVLIVIAISFLVAAVNGVFLIPLLHRLKFGQEIREEGPKWHKAKSGTPTMGGFIFIIAQIIAVAAGIFVFKLHNDTQKLMGLLAVTGAALGFGVVGFIDDYIKVILKRNLGLKAGQKFSLQFLVALLFSVWLVCGGIIDTAINIPFTGLTVGLPYWVYVPCIILVMLAAVNSVNLTDGLDGLASTITLVVCIFYCISPTSTTGKHLPLYLLNEGCLL